MQVGLVKSAVWLPPDFEDANFISEKSGLPLNVVIEKMGIKKKCRASADTHPSFMAIRAAKSVLEGVDPLSVDMIIWTGSEYKDFSVWSAGIFVQRELGLKKAWAFDIGARCSSNVVGLKIAKSLMQTHKDLKRVLLCGGHRTADLVNYRDSSSQFLFNLADGGSAMLLEKDGQNPILESAVMTDGDFSLDVIIPGSGTRKDFRAGIAETDMYLTVPNINDMRERLAERSIINFIDVIKTAATGSLPKPIDYLALLHMKRSAHDAILERLELQPEQSTYLNNYGHFGAPDQVLSLGLAERHNLLNPGAHVVLASAGIGYTWSAMSIRWDSPTFVQSTLNDFES